LHSGFWINLHHRLYEEARQQRNAVPAGAAKSPKTGKPTLQIAPGSTVVLNASEQRAWENAVSYYAANYADKDLLFSTELVLLKNQLGDFETCDELSGAKKKSCDAGLPANLTKILEAAAPVYRAHRWPADDRANRAWIKRMRAIRAVQRWKFSFTKPHMESPPRWNSPSCESVANETNRFRATCGTR
jgi:hypothetical protein